MIASLVAVIIPAAAGANFDWPMIAQNDSQTKSYFVEWISLHRIGNMVLYREKIVFKKNEGKIIQSKVLMEDDCALGYNRHLQSTIQLEDGTNLDSNFPGKWVNVSTDSAEKSIHKYVCSRS